MIIDLKEQYDLSEKYSEKVEAMKESINACRKEIASGTRLENTSPLDYDPSMFRLYRSETP